MKYVSRAGVEILVRIRKRITDTISDILFIFHGVVTFYHYPRQPADYHFIYRIRHEREALFDLPEGYHIYSAVKATRSVPGDIAEVGVYKGASSKIISTIKGKRTVYLFDTFTGLPEPTGADHIVHHKGMFRARLDDVKAYLQKFRGVKIYPGIFPETAKFIQRKKFSFVHLDVDLYKSTRDCLRFFYPRMSKGGMILSHDYGSLSGVKKAFDEFFRDKPEPIMELVGTQCLVVKL